MVKTYDIDSAKNEKFKLFATLLTGKGINEAQQALIFGKKATCDVFKNNSNYIDGVITSPELNFDGFHGVPLIYNLNQKLFNELDIFGTGAPILIVKVPEMKKVTGHEKWDGCNLVVPFQDPSNVGAVIRSAAAFGIKNIILAEGAAHPFHPRSTRAASGTVFVPHYFKISDLNLLMQTGIPCFSLDKNGQDIKKFKFPERFFLLPGVEGLGISDEIKKISKLISIPISNTVESLNATIATSVALYSWHAQNS